MALAVPLPASGAVAAGFPVVMAHPALVREKAAAVGRKAFNLVAAHHAGSN